MEKGNLKRLRQNITRYFSRCDAEGKAPTVIGLLLALGMADRRELEEYEKESTPQERTELRKAKSRIEEYHLQEICRKDPSAGAKSVLRNEFGYGEKGTAEGVPEIIQVEIANTEGGGDKS